MGRGTSSSGAGGGNYNFYCRSCGKIMMTKVMPNVCTWCGNILVDQGIGISGDNSVNETTVSITGRGGRFVSDIDKVIN